MKLAAPFVHILWWFGGFIFSLSLSTTFDSYGFDLNWSKLISFPTALHFFCSSVSSIWYYCMRLYVCLNYHKRILMSSCWLCFMGMGKASKRTSAHLYTHTQIDCSKTHTCNNYNIFFPLLLLCKKKQPKWHRNTANVLCYLRFTHEYIIANSIRINGDRDSRKVLRKKIYLRSIHRDSESEWTQNDEEKKMPECQ